MGTWADMDRIRESIRAAIEGIDDLAFDLLREAARDSSGRPPADKTLMQARRALEKAERALRTLDADEG